MYTECILNLCINTSTDLTRVKGETKKFLLVNNTNENILFAKYMMYHVKNIHRLCFKDLRKIS